jgi:hypothetical protein
VAGVAVLAADFGLVLAPGRFDVGRLFSVALGAVLALERDRCPTRDRARGAQRQRENRRHQENVALACHRVPSLG